MRKLTICGLVVVMTVVLLGLGVPDLPAPQVAEANPGTQWNAEYYNNQSLSGSPVLTRVDDQVNFNWGTGSPGEGVPVDNFSARWTKTVFFPTSGTWTFRVGVDDGVRMWIDTLQIIDKWQGSPEGFAVYEVSVDQLTAGNHDLRIEYFEASGVARIEASWTGPGGATTNPGGADTPDAIGDAADWKGEYWNTPDLAGSPTVTRQDFKVEFDWQTGSPADGIPDDAFSARWTAPVQFNQSGWWQFVLGANGGVRMWVDDTQIIEAWNNPSNTYKEYRADLYELTEGAHVLRVEYYDPGGNARIKLYWQKRTLPPELLGGDEETSGTPAQPARPAIPVWAAVTADNVNVRTGPGLGNPTIAQIFYPDDYRVLGGVADLSWLLIELDETRTGWVTNDWVYLYSSDPAMNEDTTGGGQPDFVDHIPRIEVGVAPPAAVPPEGESFITLRGQATDTLNLRDGPSAYAAEVIASVPQGAEVTVQARNRNGAWYLVEYQGIRGWVSALYVRLLDGKVRDLLVSNEIVPPPPPGSVFVPEDEAGEPVTVRGRALNNLNLRNAASLRGDMLGTVPADTEMVIEGRNTNGAWYLITFEGTQGWVNAAYVRLFEGRVSDLPIR